MLRNGLDLTLLMGGVPDGPFVQSVHGGGASRLRAGKSNGRHEVNRGQDSPHVKLQRALLPLTAGDARRGAKVALSRLSGRDILKGILYPSGALLGCSSVELCKRIWTTRSF